MSVPSLAGSLSTATRMAREAEVGARRAAYRWACPSGLPACAADVPPGEAFPLLKQLRMALDVNGSEIDLAIARLRTLFVTPEKLDAYNKYYLRWLRPRPKVAERWMTDAEFGRQRLDGINPHLIERCTSLPSKLGITPKALGQALPAGTTVEQLAATGRLFLADYQMLEGVAHPPGRFLLAPVVLLWVDDLGRLMPLAIQLHQDKKLGPVFLPTDDGWLWLLARTYVQSADTCLHEVVAHLLNTHLVVEPFWVAAARTLPAMHPIFQLLRPHFTDTIAINVAARTKLIVPGGPIDEAMAVGSEGALALAAKAFRGWTLTDADPVRDLEKRGVLTRDVLPEYHYRDDALLLYEIVGTYVHRLLKAFYRSDDELRQDEELAAWATELVSPEGAHLAGLPITNGRFHTVADLHQVLHRLIWTCSCGHAAVNGGQYAQMGYIPNAPVAMWTPPPSSKAPLSEETLVRALPDPEESDVQITLVHLLSEYQVRVLGRYPRHFFAGVPEAAEAVAHFRRELVRASNTIARRNEGLAVPYLWLHPPSIARSIGV